MNGSKYDLKLPLYHDIDPLQLPGVDGGIGKEHGKIEQCVSKRERERDGDG